MKTNLILSSMLLSLLAAPSMASAQGGEGPAPTIQSTSDAGAIRIGGGLALLPAGKLKISDGSDSVSESTDTAFGLGGSIQFQMNKYVAFDFAPRLILNLKGESGDSSGEQLDFVGRVLAGAPVSASGARIYGFAAPGYSIIFLPDDGDVDNPHGFLLGFGAGGAVPINQQLSFTAELGYQLGFQETSVQGTSVELSSNLFSITAGLLVNI